MEKFGEEKSKVVPFEKGIEIKDKINEEYIERIKIGIEKLKEAKSKFEEWQRIAEEQGDKKSVLFYETEILEIDLLIMNGEDLMYEIEKKGFDRWNDFYQRVLKIDIENDKKEELSEICSELEFIEGYLEFLSEGHNSQDSKRVQDLKNRKEELKKRKENLEK